MLLFTQRLNTVCNGEREQRPHGRQGDCYGSAERNRDQLLNTRIRDERQEDQRRAKDCSEESQS